MPEVAFILFVCCNIFTFYNWLFILIVQKLTYNMLDLIFMYFLQQC